MLSEFDRWAGSLESDGGRALVEEIKKQTGDNSLSYLVLKRSGKIPSGAFLHGENTNTIHAPEKGGNSKWIQTTRSVRVM